MATCVRWLPGSDTEFVASFVDGALVFFHKDREDPSVALNIAPNMADGLVIHKMSMSVPLGSAPTNPSSFWQVGRKEICRLFLNFLLLLGLA